MAGDGTSRPAQGQATAFFSISACVVQFCGVHRGVHLL
jgi:hypothetical protein